MPVSKMNPRQFKKLCAKCHPLVMKFVPGANTYIVDERDACDDWHRPGTLKGTKGFGGMSGYYEREWSDQSAWSALAECVFWRVAIFAPDSDDEREGTNWLVWPHGKKPHGWAGYIALAHVLVQELEGGDK